MKVDITDMLIFFDELSSHSVEERGYYWFKSTREDNISVALIFSTLEDKVTLAVDSENGVEIASVTLCDCSEIRVLDEKKKCLEVLKADGKGRCFLSLLGDSIMDYTEED